MISTSQFDNHPDAESLNAFNEQALPAGEREQILVHLAGCDRCREIVFLARQGAAEPLPQRVMPKRTPSDAKQSRVGSWRWAWIPVAAFAGMITIVVVQHGRRAAEVEVARTSGQALTGSVAVAGKDQLKNSGAGNTRVPGPRSASSKEGSDEALDKIGRGEIAQKKAPVRGAEEPIKQATNALSIPTLPEAEGFKDAREASNKPSVVGGPMMAAQLNQQQAAQQQELSVRQLQAARYSVAGGSAGNADLGAKAKQPAVHGNVVAAPVAPPVQGLTAPTSASAFDAPEEVVPLEKTKTIHLPSGLLALSAATTQGRTVAIDSTGAVFLWESAGTAWSPVARQWTGRAMHVSVRDSSTVSGAVLTAPVSPFELVNDNSQTWTSLDGKAWVPKDSQQK
jgi:hypothetical protein